MKYSEGNELLISDAMLLLDHADVLVSDGQKIADGLRRCTEDAKRRIEIERSIIGTSAYGADTAVYSKALPIYDSMLQSLRKAVLSGYETVQKTLSASEITGKNFSSFCEENMELLPDQRVIARASDGIISVKLPMLWRKNITKSPGIKPGILGSGKNVFFRDDIVYALKNSREFSALDISSFAKKHVYFHFIYNWDERPKHFIPDSDNYETKYIQDAVTCMLPCGDAAPSCMTTYASAETKSVPTGTYVTVTPAEKDFLRPEDIIAFWAEKLAGSTPD